MSRDDFEWPEEEYPRHNADKIVADFKILDYCALKSAIETILRTFQNSTIDRPLLLKNARDFLEKCGTETAGDKIRLVCLALLLSENNILKLHEDLTTFYFIFFTEENGTLKPAFTNLDKRAIAYYAEVQSDLEKTSKNTEPQKTYAEIVIDAVTAMGDQLYDATVVASKLVYTSTAVAMKTVSDVAVNAKKNMDDALCAAMKERFFPRVTRIAEKPVGNESKERSPTI